MDYLLQFTSTLPNTEGRIRGQPVQAGSGRPAGRFGQVNEVFSSQLALNLRIAVTTVDARIMCLMSETPDTPTVRTSTAPASAPAAEPVRYKAPRVFVAAAWVAIVAGIVFIVSVIFFTGMALGHHGHHHHHHKHHMMMHPHRFGPGGPGGPGAGGPPGANQGGGPASVAPGAPGPSQIPSSVAPTRTP